MVVMAQPNPDSLLAALEEAVQRVHTVDSMLQHRQVTARCAALHGTMQAFGSHVPSTPPPSPRLLDPQTAHLAS